MSLLTDLKAYWKLDEVSGARVDSVAGHSLSDNNTVTYGNGKQGRAASFAAATSEFLKVNDHADLSLGGVDAWTIAFWAKSGDTGYTPLISKRSDASVGHTANNEYTITQYVRQPRPHEQKGTTHEIAYSIHWGQMGGPQTGYIPWYGNQDSSAPNGSGQCETGGTQWNFVSLSLNQVTGDWMWALGPWFSCEATVNQPDPPYPYFDGSSPRFWYGNLAPYLAANGTDTSHPFRLGAGNDSGPFYEGMLDEVGIWHRYLPEGDIRSLYNGGMGTTYPFDEQSGSEMDWMSTGSLEALHRRHRTPDRTNPVFVQHSYSWPGFLNDKYDDVPDVTDWGSPPEVPVLPREHRRAPYRAYSQEDRNIYPDVSDWWLQASEPVMARKGAGEREYWAAGMNSNAPSGDPAVPTTNPSVSSPSSATGGGDDTVIPPTAEPSIDGKSGLYIPERPDQEDTLRPRVDDPE